MFIVLAAIGHGRWENVFEGEEPFESQEAAEEAVEAREDILDTFDTLAVFQFREFL